MSKTDNDSDRYPDRAKTPRGIQSQSSRQIIILYYPVSVFCCFAAVVYNTTIQDNDNTKESLWSYRPFSH
jgi:hypothetical protein